MSEPTRIVVDGPVVDTLTVKFWRDSPGLRYAGPAINQPWACHVGDNMAEGAVGFGKTPLEALRQLCNDIDKSEGTWTDGGRLRLR